MSVSIIRVILVFKPYRRKWQGADIYSIVRKRTIWERKKSMETTLEARIVHIYPPGKSSRNFCHHSCASSLPQARSNSSNDHFECGRNRKRRQSGRGCPTAHRHCQNAGSNLTSCREISRDTVEIWIRTIWIQKHLKTKLLEVQISNGSVFKWSAMCFVKMLCPMY